jgi:hypothetical protein
LSDLRPINYEKLITWWFIMFSNRPCHEGYSTPAIDGRIMRTEGLRHKPTEMGGLDTLTLPFSCEDEFTGLGMREITHGDQRAHAPASVAW